MTAERWRDIERVFEAVSACPAEQRQTRLREECAGDEELRREVDALLTCDGDDDRFVEDSVQAAAASLTRESAGTAVGRRMGPYRITRAIGRGGMGTVYEA